MIKHQDELKKLGPGHHFGEWWGSKIQRGYGLDKGDKRFSLFNTTWWTPDALPACCSVVPVLYQGIFNSHMVDFSVDKLRAEGSQAAPGFMQPEGVVIYHTAANMMFKKTCEKDEQHKSQIVMV